MTRSVFIEYPGRHPARIDREEDKSAIAALASSAFYLSVGLASSVVTLITSRGSQAWPGRGTGYFSHS